MKYFLIVLLFLTFNINAATGSAFIPQFHTSSYGNDDLTTKLQLSNITNKSVNVILKLFNYNGEIIVDDQSESSGYIRGLHTSEFIEGSIEDGFTVSLTIEPKSTSILTLRNYFFRQGFGKINWSIENSERKKALLAHGTVYGGQGNISYSIPINNGKPF